MSDDLVKQAIAELRDVVRCRCRAAYTNIGKRDPDCECDSAEAVKVVADRIEELEAKLAKAMNALDEANIAMMDFIVLPDANCSCHINPPCHDCVENAQARGAVDLVIATLAELKGTGQ